MARPLSATRGTAGSIDGVNCCPPGNSAFDREFNAATPKTIFAHYRRNGPTGLTKALIEALSAGGDRGALGPRDRWRRRGGASRAPARPGPTRPSTSTPRAPTCSAAREESERQGHADRVEYRVGDFVALADVIDPADVVALDRVICCYSDMSSLVARSAALAKASLRPRLPALHIRSVASPSR